ncbi:PAS domain S-box-containing protein [Tenacibaculum skagerrakense]|uniref:histidine kinase n=1 Tax=Tenacibaculum skagerrakense TaxID=186571 RepID=A0A4R2NX53_9FLAO|nr:ATP-binding protein [Tenacibaculum skagerrakense]TCP26753.1 PAS domain S-box-containing protein [Tenacibaculum skagerrakense]
MITKNIEVLEKALEREKQARIEAEKNLEEKTSELLKANLTLRKVINEKEIQLHSLFQTIVDPYILMDLYGNVVKMNDAAADFFGYDIENEVFNVISLLVPEDVPFAKKTYYRLLEKGAIKNYKARVFNKNKEIRWIEISPSIVYDEKGKPTFTQGVLRDITDRLTIQKEKELLLKNLKKSNQELNDFAHVVSHDLKAPLRSMNALVSWLQEDCLELSEDESIKENFELLLKKIDKMDHLINGILKYASIDKIEHPKKDIDLQEVVDIILDTIHIPENVKVIIPEKLPIAEGDKFRLHQLFQNLISNAVKYADKDNGEVSITYETKKDFWEFQISDNGKGIPKKYHKKVFGIFETLDDHQNSTGIGLSIVKKIIDLFDGTIWVSSIEGEGATFHFTLPIPN